MGAACAGETGRTGASSVPPREADAAGVMRVSGTPLNGAGAGSSSNTKGAGRAGRSRRALEGKIVEWVSGVRLSRDGGIISAQEIEIQLLHSRERFIVRRLFFNRLLRGRRFFHRYILRLKARAGKEVRRRHKNTAFSKFKAGRKTPASPRRTGRAAAGRRLSAMALFYSIPHAHASPAGKKAAFLREV